MALSAEAIIALVALFIACTPGVQFVVQNRERLRQWWSRENNPESPALPLSDHNLPPEDNHENDQVNNTPGSHTNNTIGQPHFIPSSTPDSSQHNVARSSIFEPVYTVLQSYYENGNRGQSAQESGLVFFTRSFDAGRTGEHEPLMSVSTDGASASHEESHQLV